MCLKCFEVTCVTPNLNLTTPILTCTCQKHKQWCTNKIAYSNQNDMTGEEFISCYGNTWLFFFVGSIEHANYSLSNLFLVLLPRAFETFYIVKPPIFAVH